MKSLLFTVVLAVFGCTSYATTHPDLTTTDKDNTARINVYVGDVERLDTLYLVFWPQCLGTYVDKYLPQVKKVARKNKDGFFSFTIPEITEPGYFSIYCEGHRSAFDADGTLTGYTETDLLTKYLVEPGDDIKITFHHVEADSHGGAWNNQLQDGLDYIKHAKENQYVLSFSGKGSAKYTCKYQIDFFASIPPPISSVRNSITIVDSLGKLRKDNFPDEVLRFGLNKVESFKGGMTPLSYEIVKANVLSKCLYNRLEMLVWQLIRNKGNAAFNNLLARSYSGQFLADSSLFTGISLKGLLYSNFYADYAYSKAYMTQKVISRCTDSCLPATYNELKQGYSGELRDKILADCLLTEYVLGAANGNAILQDAVATAGGGFWRDQLQQLEDAQGEGKPAYDFALLNMNGDKLRLSDFKGKVVFIDFWYTGCENCAGFYQSQLSKVEHHFKDSSNVVFITISIDVDRTRWIQSLKSGLYTSSTDAINLYTNGQGIKHQVIQYYHVSGYPNPLLIDKEGKIYKANPSRHAEALTSLINEALNKKAS